MLSINRILSAIFCLFPVAAFPQPKPQNIIIITLDGFRWQEMFTGADEELINHKDFSPDTAALKSKYWAPTAEERRKKLLPFFWTTIAAKGQLHGNRLAGSKVNVRNRYWFSYPGYNEIFTGYPDTLVNSNDKVPNKNVSILEMLNKMPAYKGKVAVFASWDRFDAIFNEPRAGFLVNSGIDPLKIRTPRFDLLNEMQRLSPQPLGDEIRSDNLTYFLAKEYIKQNKPRVLYIAFDETDDYAHGGHYDQYLNMAHMTDQWIADLWSMLQGMPEYKDKTTLLILTDHGRGDKVKTEWTTHNNKTEGADQIWFAAMGVGIGAKGECRNEEQLYQSQLSPTIAKLLSLVFKNGQSTDGPMPGVIK